MKMRFSQILEGKIVPKYPNVSQTGSSMKFITPVFSKYSRINVKTCLLGGGLCTCHQIEAFQGFYLNFLISSNPKY